MVVIVYETDHAGMSAPVGETEKGLRSRLALAAKIGFWVLTAALGLQLFTTAVYFAHL